MVRGEHEHGGPTDSAPRATPHRLLYDRQAVAVPSRNRRGDLHRVVLLDQIFGSRSGDHRGRRKPRGSGYARLVSAGAGNADLGYGSCPCRDSWNPDRPDDGLGRDQHDVDRGERDGRGAPRRIRVVSDRLRRRRGHWRRSVGDGSLRHGARMVGFAAVPRHHRRLGRPRAWSPRPWSRLGPAAPARIRSRAASSHPAADGPALRRDRDGLLAEPDARIDGAGHRRNHPALDSCGHGLRGPVIARAVRAGRDGCIRRRTPVRGPGMAIHPVPDRRGSRRRRCWRGDRGAGTPHSRSESGDHHARPCRRR